MGLSYPPPKPPNCDYRSHQIATTEITRSWLPKSTDRGREPLDRVEAPENAITAIYYVFLDFSSHPLFWLCSLAGNRCRHHRQKLLFTPLSRQKPTSISPYSKSTAPHVRFEIFINRNRTAKVLNRVMRCSQVQRF